MGTFNGDLKSYLKYSSVIDEDLDEMFLEAAKVVIEAGKASASYLQRRLALGYARSARILNQLEACGVISVADGAVPRDVLITSIEEVKKIVKSLDKNVTTEDEEAPKKPFKPNLSAIKPVANNPWEYSLSDLLDPKLEHTKNALPLGFDDNGEISWAELNKPGNILITGNTVSQKEVVLDTLLSYILLKYSDEDLRLIICDSTRYLNLYDEAPHLLTPVINEIERMIAALMWSQSEIDRRNKLFAEQQVRTIEQFNESGFHIDRVVIVINHLDDLIMFAPSRVKDLLDQIAKHGKRAGITLIMSSSNAKVSLLPLELQSSLYYKLFLHSSYPQEVGPNKVKKIDELAPGNGLLLTVKGKKVTPLKLVYTSIENIKAINS